jgi:hypothetical protein
VTTCKVNFAAGFYGLSVDKSSQPYLAFFVPDCGFFTWQHMPFGVTGAPTAFGCMAAEALDGLVGHIMELFVDNGGAANDDFDCLLGKMQTIFERACKRKLLLSPQKSAFFVSQMTFAGGLVSSSGLTADPAKVASVVNWEQPQTVHNLMGFLGTTGYFQPLIQDYSRIAKPLSDLCRHLEIPRGPEQQLTTQKWKALLKAKKLDSLQGKKHMRAFIALKWALTTAPVLRTP